MTDRASEHDRPVVLGVAGGSGSGKTTVVQAIVSDLTDVEVSLVHHDSYYRDFTDLTPSERNEINFDHPDALETELLVEHLETLRSGSPIETPVYDFRRHRRTERTRRVEPTPIVIVDGILVFAVPELRALMDIKVFVDTDADVRLVRRLRRDVEERGRSVESVLRQYERTVRPMHLEFVEPSRRHADVIIPEGGRNRVAVEMLTSRLGALLR